MDFENIDDRLENWGKVVRSPRFQYGECAAWAKWYVALRDSGKAPDMPTMTKDERDGWLIEKAWSDLPNHTYKWALKYSHVWRMDPDQVSTRMRKSHGISMRGIKVELVLAQAKTALCKNIASLTTKEILKFVSKDACKQESCVI
jgi:hypothetical protein